jgi:Zn-dependent protease with chaperone function
MVGPVLALYYLSRQFEYAADRFAVELTQAPETGINALASLYRITQAPSNYDGIIELFMTHPSFTHRAQAIGEAGKMPEEKVLEIIRETQGYGVVLG